MERIELCDNYSEIRVRIVRLLRSYLKENNIETMVIGLSGGVDSTLTAALAREAADQGNFTLMGYSLPTKANQNCEVNVARMAGEAFCHGFREKNLTRVSTRVFDEFEPFPGGDLFRLKVQRGNIIARLRMIYLYNVANAMNGIVLSTDNLTELMLGFWTLHGDVGDFGCIQSLWKTEVYGLAEYLFTECLAAEEYDKSEALFQATRAVPTDGLGITKSDLDQLGADSYEEVDRRLIEFFEKRVARHECPIIERHMATMFKRDNPYNLQREEIIP